MFIQKTMFLATLALVVALLANGCSTAGQNENNNSDRNNSGSNSDITENNSDKTVVYFFWGDGCPHCAEQKPWLEELEEEYSDLEIKMLEAYNNRENARLFQEMGRAYGIQARGVPATFIGDFDPIVGFSESAKPGIENKIKTCLDKTCIDPGSKL